MNSLGTSRFLLSKERGNLNLLNMTFQGFGPEGLTANIDWFIKYKTMKF